MHPSLTSSLEVKFSESQKPKDFGVRETPLPGWNCFKTQATLTALPPLRPVALWVHNPAVQGRYLQTNLYLEHQGDGMFSQRKNTKKIKSCLKSMDLSRPFKTVKKNIRTCAYNNLMCIWVAKRNPGTTRFRHTIFAREFPLTPVLPIHLSERWRYPSTQRLQKHRPFKQLQKMLFLPFLGKNKTCEFSPP